MLAVLFVNLIKLISNSAKYDQVDSPPSDILNEYTDDDYYLSHEPHKGDKGKKIKPPSHPDALLLSTSNSNRRKKKSLTSFENIQGTQIMLWLLLKLYCNYYYHIIISIVIIMYGIVYSIS